MKNKYFFTLTLCMLIHSQLLAIGFGDVSSFFSSKFNSFISDTLIPLTKSIKSEIEDPKLKIKHIIEDDGTPNGKEAETVKTLLAMILAKNGINTEASTNSTQTVDDVQSNEAFTQVAFLSRRLSKKFNEHYNNATEHPRIHWGKLGQGAGLCLTGLISGKTAYNIVCESLHEGPTKGSCLAFLIATSVSISTFWPGIKTVKSGFLYGKNLQALIEKDKTIYTACNEALMKIHAKSSQEKQTQIQRLIEQRNAQNPGLITQIQK